MTRDAEARDDLDTQAHAAACCVGRVVEWTTPGLRTHGPYLGCDLIAGADHDAREGDPVTDDLIYTNEHKTLIDGLEYRFQMRPGRLVAEHRRFASAGPWVLTSDPPVLEHLAALAEDLDRQVLHLRATEDLQRELEQNGERIDVLQRRNGCLAAELRARVRTHQRLDRMAERERRLPAKETP